MKWLFFILLLINMSLFVWIYPQINEPAPENSQPTGRGNLLLLSETEEAESSSTTGEEISVEVGESADVETEIASTDNKQMSLTGAFPERNEVQGGIPEAEFSPSVDQAEVAAGPSIDTQVQIDQAPEPEPLPIAQCARVGPLGKRAEADQLSLRLRALGLQPDLNSELSNEQEGYWVLVPPQKNRAAAVRIVQGLQEAGITDLWRFTSGKLAHAISLGLFRDEARAEIRRKSIADKGFDVEVRPRYRQKTHYWLSYSYPGDSPVTEDQWAALVKRYPGIEQRSIDCQEIATQ